MDFFSEHKKKDTKAKPQGAKLTYIASYLLSQKVFYLLYLSSIKMYLCKNYVLVDLISG